MKRSLPAWPGARAPTRLPVDMAAVGEAARARSEVPVPCVAVAGDATSSNLEFAAEVIAACRRSGRRGFVLIAAGPRETTASLRDIEDAMHAGTPTEVAAAFDSVSSSAVLVAVGTAFVRDYRPLLGVAIVTAEGHQPQGCDLMLTRPSRRVAIELGTALARVTPAPDRP